MGMCSRQSAQCACMHKATTTLIFHLQNSYFLHVHFDEHSLAAIIESQASNICNAVEPHDDCSRCVHNDCMFLLLDSVK